MIAWNLITLFMVIGTLVEAYTNSWRFPKFNSFATIAGMWFIGSIILHLMSNS